MTLETWHLLLNFDCLCLPPMKIPVLPTLPYPASFRGVYFVTLRLRDALPRSFGQNLGLQYYHKQLEFAGKPDAELLTHQVRKKLFSRFEEALDLEKYGPAYFREPSLAKLIGNTILDSSEYVVHAYSILPNHVHLLLEFQEPGSGVLEIDSFEQIDYKPLREAVRTFQEATESAVQEALRTLDKPEHIGVFQHHNPQGVPAPETELWHEQSFDFQIPDKFSFEKTRRYILLNAANAHLVDNWSAWPFLFWRTQDLP